MFDENKSKALLLWFIWYSYVSRACGVHGCVHQFSVDFPPFLPCSKFHQQLRGRFSVGKVHSWSKATTARSWESCCLDSWFFRFPTMEEHYFASFDLGALTLPRPCCKYVSISKLWATFARCIWRKRQFNYVLVQYTTWRPPPAAHNTFKDRLPREPWNEVASKLVTIPRTSVSNIVGNFYSFPAVLSFPPLLPSAIPMLNIRRRGYMLLWISKQHCKS